MITSERIDDVPLLVYWLLQMRVDKIIDDVLGVVHGNRQGLSYGQLAVVYIAYILTECNHFLSPVRDWVLARRASLAQALGQPIRDTDFTDDRLADLLHAVGAEGVGEQIEGQLGRHLIRAYALPTDTARIDTTTVSVYHQPQAEGSVLDFGHSKDHRPDLRQFKQVLGTLDPAGLPLCSATVGGECADDPLYLPAWRQMAQIIGQPGFLVVGDCKLASLENRAQIQRENGFYLAPLALTGTAPDDLRRWVLNPPTSPVDLYLPGLEKPVGQGFEVIQPRTWTDPTTGQVVTWEERVLALRSDKLATCQQRGLEARLARAERELGGLKPQAEATLDSLTAQSQAILEQHRVSAELRVAWTPHTAQVKRYLKRGRHGPDSPCAWVTTTRWQLTVARQAEAIETCNRLAGWRLFVTNAQPSRLDLKGAVACYREEWQPERGFHRLKGGVLAVRPLFLRADQRIRGLLLILVIALRALTLLEFVARRSLAQQPEPLQGLYPGNPKRATARPTTERLLLAFDGLTRYRLDQDGSISYQITPLSRLQRRILNLLGVPETIYSVLGDPLLDST